MFYMSKNTEGGVGMIGGQSMGYSEGLMQSDVDSVRSNHELSVEELAAFGEMNEILPNNVLPARSNGKGLDLAANWDKILGKECDAGYESRFVKRVDETDASGGKGKGKQVVDASLSGLIMEDIEVDACGDRADKEDEVADSGSKNVVGHEAAGSSMGLRTGIVRPMNPIYTSDITHMIEVHDNSADQVTIGRHFVRETNLHQASDVVLRGPDGDEWRIRVKKYRHVDREVIVKFGKGWKAFHRHFKLVKGDGVMIAAPAECVGDSAPSSLKYEIFN